MTLGEGRWARGLGRCLGCVVPAGLVVAAVLFLADLYGGAPLGGVDNFHSDDLYTVDICRQAVAGYDLRGCHLPYTPYVFPDMVLQLPGMALSSDVGIVFLTYGLLYYGLTVVVLAWIARQCGVPWREGFCHGCGGVALLLATHLAGPYFLRGMLLAHPANHAGIILVGLFLVGLCLQLVRQGPTLAVTAVFLLVGGLGAFSDKLLIVQFLAPLSLALFVLCCLRQLSIRRLLVGAVWIGGAFAISEALRWAAARHGFILLPVEDDLKLAGIGDMLRFLLTKFPTCFAGQYVAVAVMLAGGLAATAAAVHAALKRRPEVLLAALVCLLACLSNIGAVLLVGLGPFALAFPRYTLVLVLLPFLFLSVFVRLLPGRISRVGVALAVVAAVGAVAQLGVRAPTFAWRHLRQPYPALARAVDELARERGLRYGLADYWSARTMSLLSREGVRLKTLAGNGAPWLHGDNPNSYLLLGPADRSLPPYRFIVLARGPRPCAISADAVLGLYGEPTERRIVDAEWEIWLYDELDSPRFNRFLAGVLAQQYRGEHHYEAPSWPPQLARPKANLSRWDARRNVPTAAGNAVDIRFAHPVTGAAIDFAADAGNAYQVALYRDEERVGTLRAPACWTGVVWNYDRKGVHTMFSRLLPLPAGLQGRPWNRAIVHCLGGAENARLGHFLVYDEAPPLPDLVRGPKPHARRFEAEALPAVPHAALASADDPSASGGRFRRAGPEFAGPVVFGPYIPLNPGRYRVDFAVRAEGSPSAGPVGHVDATAFLGARVLAARNLDAEDVQSDGGFRTVSLVFDIDDELDSVEFRLFARGGTALAVDYVDLIPLQEGDHAP
jgi:hypothetical protein